MDRIQLVVVNGHTLGYITPKQKTTLNILHSSILKGAIFELYLSAKLINKSDTVRLASEKDFKDFRVSFEGFNNKKEYCYVD